MRMKKLWIYFSILLVCFLSSCNSGEEEFLKDTYIEGQDYQYMFTESDFDANLVARGDKGYYTCMHHFILYFDPETKTATPLCNKVDCLHDKEENEELMKKCHAYVDFTWDGPENQIVFYNGALYMLNPSNEDNYGELIKFPIDGSERTIVRTFEEGSISYWLIHRGYMYFVSNYYSITDEEGGVVNYRNSLLRCSVNNTKKEIELIYEPEEGLSEAEALTPRAYGNHIYFFRRGFTKEVDSGVNYRECLAWKSFQYDIRTKEIREIIVEDQKDNPYAYVSFGSGTLDFVDDKILFHACDIREEEVKLNYGIGTQWYMADLDGSNQKKILKTEYKYNKVYCDGNYIYEDTQWAEEDLSLQAEEKGEKYKLDQKYYIYDKDMKLIDTMRFPFDHIVNPAVGDEKFQFWSLGDEKVGALAYIDKKQVGTFKGEYPDIVEVYRVNVPN